MFDRILFTWSHNVRRRNNNLQETNKQNEKNWQRISQISIFSLFSDKKFSVLRQKKKPIIKNKIEKVQPSSSHHLSAFERFSKNLINSPKKTKRKINEMLHDSRGKRAVSSVYLLPPWAFAPNPFCCSCRAAGPLNTGLSSSVPDWVSFALRLRFSSRTGLVHIQNSIGSLTDIIT